MIKTRIVNVGGIYYGHKLWHVERLDRFDGWTFLAECTDYRVAQKIAKMFRTKG